MVITISLLVSPSRTTNPLIVNFLPLLFAMMSVFNAIVGMHRVSSNWPKDTMVPKLGHNTAISLVVIICEICIF